MAIPHGTAEQAKFKAYTAFSTGDFSSAVRHFSEAMSVGPSNYLLYSNRSSTYARLGEYSKALADAVKTVQLKPDWPKGYIRLGDAHFGLGHFDEAVAAYTKGLECDSYDEGLKVGLAKARSATSEPERKALAQKEKDLGNSAYMMKDFYTAIAHYTKAIELSDEDISFPLDRALTYLKMGQYVECIKDCDKAVESGRKLRSDSKMIAIALTRKGTALVKMAKCSQDYEPAIKIFRKALTEHHNPDTLKELDDAIKAKRDRATTTRTRQKKKKKKKATTRIL